MSNLDKEYAERMHAAGRKFRIVPKRDFGNGKGYWLPNVPGGVGTHSYGFVKSGFVVSCDGCNIMPAATWFRSVGEAVDALRILIECDFNGHSFWAVMHAKYRGL